jgi:hypothetical protein
MRRLLKLEALFVLQSKVLVLMASLQWQLYTLLYATNTLETGIEDSSEPPGPVIKYL